MPQKGPSSFFFQFAAETMFQKFQSVPLFKFLALCDLPETSFFPHSGTVEENTGGLC